MAGNTKIIVRDYLRQLRENKKGKPDQIRDALEIYVGLWEKAIENGTVSQEDEVGVALAKLDKIGGLYKATE